MKHTDKNYATIPEKNGRAITGLSMGGHGALWLAIRHKEIFGAGGSTSGGVDIRPFPKNWEMNKQLGDYESDKTLWDQHTVITQVDKIKDGDLALIIDCGEQDFFLEVNKALHKVLLEKNISHDFITRPGGHNGQYWNNSIDYQILFFDKFFKELIVNRIIPVLPVMPTGTVMKSWLIFFSSRTLCNALFTSKKKSCSPQSIINARSPSLILST